MGSKPFAFRTYAHLLVKSRSIFKYEESKMLVSDRDTAQNSMHMSERFSFTTVFSGEKSASVSIFINLWKVPCSKDEQIVTLYAILLWTTKIVLVLRVSARVFLIASAVSLEYR